MKNPLREALGKEFTVTVEVVTPERAKPLDEALAPARKLGREVAHDPRVAGLSVTDRVRSDDDHDPVLVATALAEASGKAPVVHLSGKDRTPADLARTLGRLAGAGLENVLCVTGDRVKNPPIDRPVRYVDSVDAVRLARERVPGSFVAAGVSPFKYTEEETLNQYLKMGMKHAAGADYLITQVGWDMRKLAELARYRAEQGFAQPVMANLMVLPLGGARFIHKGAVPGVVVTDDLLAIVEWEAQAPDKGRAARLTRLALQLVGAEQLGYGGVQLSGLGVYEDVCRVLDLAAELRARLPTAGAWWHAWEANVRLPNGVPAQLGRDPGFRLCEGDHSAGAAARPPAGARQRVAGLRALHAVAFSRASPMYWLLRPLARHVPTDSPLAAWLARVEHRIKGPLFGCQVCGFCRLPDTFYVCPETCPKGLANGPCGGSTGNLCEAGDRECFHSARYRLAKASGRMDQLARTLIPPVPDPRGGSSWLNHFAGRTPRASGRPSAAVDGSSLPESP